MRETDRTPKQTAIGGRATAPSAVQHASTSKHWAECAYWVRGELRAHGVKGELRLLKDYSCGDRGKAAEKQMRELAEIARENGMPAGKLAQRLGVMAAGIVADVYRETLDPAA